jgi:protein-S-isoprenylcysteine O-methyltransferase Ste14
VRYAGLLYGVTAYVLAIGYWPLFIVFIGNSPRPNAPFLDPSVSTASNVLPTWQALTVDAALIGAFALQHSFLARPAIKRVWGRLVAEPFRRATFTQLANIFAFAIVLHWQPVPIVLWQLDHDSVLRHVIVPLWQLGWVLLLLGAMSFKLTALFGLRQIWFWFKGKPYEPVDVTASKSYHLARHPEFLGVFLLIWVTADMTVGHFLLASSLTLYSFMALHIRERELVKQLGAAQQAYQARVPMLGPRWAVASLFVLWLSITGVEIVQSLEQRREDAQARADLHRLRQAIVDYRERTGTIPMYRSSTYTCERPDFGTDYENLMTQLTSAGVLDNPLARADRHPSDAGYCYVGIHDVNVDVHWVLWTELQSGTLSNAGETGTCRPFTSADGLGYCERDRASRHYCLCVTTPRAK